MSEDPTRPDSSPGDSAAEQASLKKRAVVGGIALAARTVVLQLIVLSGTVILARRLSPSDFGAFAIVQFALAFLTSFGDAGLGGALIQKKEAPTQGELSSVFWAQVGIGVCVLAVVWPTSAWIRLIWPDLPASAPWIMRALAVNFLATSVRVVPSILMERELKFVRISLLDTLGSTSFYLAASAAALLDAGVLSLVAGVLVQGGVGLVVAYALRPFRPSLVFDRPRLRELLRFGVPFQLKFVVGMVHGAVTPLYGGAVLGASAVGLINWAQNTAQFSLRAVDIVSRVSFPLYSRMQSDRAELGRTFEKNLRLGAFVTFLFSGVLLGLGPQITSIVYSERWLPALPLLRVHALAITLGFIGPLVATVLDAMNLPQIMLRLSIAVTVGTWILLPISTRLWGPMGFVLGYVFFMVTGNIYILAVLRKKLPEARAVRQLFGPAAGLAATWALGTQWLGSQVGGVASLVGAVLVSVVAFVSASSIVDPTPARDLLALVKGKKG